MFNFIKNRGRRRLSALPFPAEWLTILVTNFLLYSRLSVEDQQELQKHIQIFLSEKNYEGCDGLEITSEIKITIAAQACLLLLHRETDYYPQVSSILVYPASYIAPDVEYLDHGLVTESEEECEGEAWQEGVVVLSWDDVRLGAKGADGGNNLVIHEFAHQLDMEDHEADGVPVLPHHSMYAPWAKVFSAEYKRLQSDIKNNHATIFDEEEVSDPAEFFAVATEFFYVIPEKFNKFHPKLYELLKDFYRQDPIQYYREN